MDLINWAVQFWNSLGWLANAFGIVAGLIAVVAFVPVASGWITAKRLEGKFKNVADYVGSRISDPAEAIQKIKQAARIAIVDDNLDDFPIDYLRRAGFHVDTFTQISLAETNKLAHYDVVFLDIVGVVLEDKRAGGLELIKRIRAMQNRPSVIAVSGKKFDPTVTDFFKQADDVMRKPISENACEEHITDVLEQRLSPCRAAKDLDEVLGASKLSADEYGALVRELVAYIRGRTDGGEMRKRLTRKYGVQDPDRVMGYSDKIRGWFEK